MNIKDLKKHLGCKGERIDKRKMINLGLVVGFFFLFSISYFSTEVMAQDIYPAKDVIHIVGAEAGGGFDAFARMTAPFQTKYLKEVSPGCKGGEVKVKNMPGGGHAKAMIYMYEARPDGYTFADFNRADVYKFSYGSEKLSFDIKEFTWLACFTKTLRIVVSKKTWPKTWAQMVTFAKNNPPLIATSTVGSSEHMETIWFKEVCELPGKITSTGGSRDTVGALLRGDADLTLIDYAAIKTLVESGDVNPLVSMTEERIIPGVPTIREVGYPKCLEFIGGTLGRNLIGPPKMDPEAKRILVSAFRKMVADPEFQAYCKKTGNELSPLYEKDQEAAMMKYYDSIMKNVQMFNKYGL